MAVRGTLTLDAPVTALPTVRGRVATGLARLGIRTIRHLLFHFPARHEDRSTFTPLGDVAAGVPVVVRGRITEMTSEASFRRRGGRTRRMFFTHATVADDSGALAVVWFHQRYLVGQFPVGTPVVLSGTVSLSERGLSLVAPEIERAQEGKTLIHAGRIVPIYPETAGVTSRLLRFLISRVLPLTADLTEYLPASVQEERELAPIQDAVREIHFPESFPALERARQRLAFDELFLLQLAALVRKRERTLEAGVPLAVSWDDLQDAVGNLPFSLTPSQAAAVRDILGDLRQPVPMNRLLTGDVGSGKTVVAGLVALAVARAGGQTVFVAPTEILAQQHGETLRELFATHGLSTAVLTGSLKGPDRRVIADAAARGDLHCLVGTHALFHADLAFQNLALVIVDEQHRFGVEQRGELTRRRRDGRTPHFLSMTATPIPRTLQLTAYGDVDVTPLAPRPGQQQIATVVVPPEERHTTYASLANRVRAGEQVFVVCPRVEEGEDDVRSVVAETRRLTRDVFPTFRVGMLHGKLPADEKQHVLAQFRAHALDVLVASSVVEVGVDIPHATALLVEGAERFGLSQLHQLRGRVGRRGQAAVCYLASASAGGAALGRLRVLERSTQGLDIAEEDLKRRGAGEVYGTRQSGGVRLTMANLADVGFLHEVRQSAEVLLARDPMLKTAHLLARRVAAMNVTTHFE